MTEKNEEKILSEQEKKEKILSKLFEVPVKAVVLKGDKVLVLKRSLKLEDDSDNRYAGKYDLPGGAAEHGETITESIKREVKEETSLDIEVGPVVGVTDSEKEYLLDEKREKKMSVYVKAIRLIAYYKSGEVKLSDEHDSFEWLTFDEAIKKFDKKDDFERKKGEAVEKAQEYLKMQNALDSWKRCQADFDNYKKSQAAHQEEFRKYAKMDVTLQILPVVDNFEASLAHVPAHSKENKWVEGIVYIKRQLEDILKNNDIEEIEVKIGDKFNPEIHEAVGGDGKKQKVKKVIQKGYKLNGRILRAAKVEVE
ncbi:MAG: nucleotide exchange factor GrpE [Candidatus Moranbacteria bacterium]|nr:nucleotide exchange factor GrpE [Candidatus Moranbacteria bacterium]